MSPTVTPNPLAVEAVLYAQNQGKTVLVCESTSERDEIAHYVLERLRAEAWLAWEIDFNLAHTEGDLAKLLLTRMSESAPELDRDAEDLAYALGCLDSMAEMHPVGVFIAWKDFHLIDRRELRQAESLLRLHIQAQPRAAYLFVGDHRITPIFSDPQRPFFRSTMWIDCERSRSAISIKKA